MNVITRRDVLQSSGLALAAPFASSLLPTVAFGQTTYPMTKLTISHDLQNYVTQNVPQIIAKARTHSLDYNDLKDFSGKLRLFAHHLDTVNIDPLRVSILSAPPITQGVELWKSDEATSAYSEIAATASDFAYHEFRSYMTFSATQLEAGRQILSGTSLESQFHSLADAFDAIAHNSRVDTSGLFTPTGMHFHHGIYPPHLTHAIYNSDSHAHIVLAGFCGLSWRQWCEIVGFLLAAGIALALIWSGGGIVAGTLAWMAAQLGWEVAFLVKVLASIGIIAGLLSGLCGV